MLYQKFCFTLTISIISFFQIACNTQAGEKIEKDIVDVRNGKEPEADIAAHKPFDVEVFKINFMGAGYKVRYYQKENGSLAYHEASYITNEDFDKTSYKWLTDTSVAIKLVNSETNKEKRFEVFGKGSSSGLRD